MSSTSIPAPPRKRKARGKVRLEKMQDEKALTVTYSKRRAGAFKKANELCILTDAEVTLVTFSPADKPYSFGSPNIQTNVDRLLGLGHEHHAAPTNDGLQQLVKAQQERERLRQSNELKELEATLAKEKERAKQLQAEKAQGQMQKWYPRSTEESSFDELGDLLSFLEGFNEKIREEEKKSKVIGEGSSSLFLNQDLAWKQKDVPGSSSNPPPFGLDELPIGFQDTGMQRVNVNHHCDFQAQYGPTSGFGSNAMNNDSIGLDSMGLVPQDVNFGNQASFDLIGQQVPQDPFTTHQYVPGLVSNDQNHASYDPIGQNVPQDPTMDQYDPTGLFSDYFTQDDMDMVSSFLDSSPVDLVPNDTNFDAIGPRATNAPSTENLYQVNPTQPEPSSAPDEANGSGVNLGESGSFYDFNFPPSDFSIPRRFGVFPGEFNGGSGSGQQ